ncbi:MAG: hypothetical protein AB8F94_20360 [Saprospiraceae bacterium]
MKRLKDFKKMGVWEFGEKENKYNYTIPDEIIKKKIAIYAFIENGKVMYVGQTQRTVKARFDSYAGNKKRFRESKSKGSGKYLAPAIDESRTNKSRIIEIWLWFPNLDDYEIILKQKSNEKIEKLHSIDRSVLLNLLESKCIAEGGKPPWNAND